MNLKCESSGKREGSSRLGVEQEYTTTGWDVRGKRRQRGDLKSIENKTCRLHHQMGDSHAAMGSPQRNQHGRHKESTGDSKPTRQKTELMLSVDEIFNMQTWAGITFCPDVDSQQKVMLDGSMSHHQHTTRRFKGPDLLTLKWFYVNRRSCEVSVSSS